MKEYPLTKGELWILGGIQAGSALCFSLAGICFGFWENVKQQLAFAGSANAHTIEYWHGVGDMAFYGMIGLAIVAVGLFLISGLNVRAIIKATTHD